MPNLAERVVRVRLLLETLEDPYPTPRGALQTDSGPAPSRYVPCETCQGHGERRERRGWVICLVCDGRGEKRREREPAWDAYVGLPLDEANALPRAPTLSSTVPEHVHEQTYMWERLRRTYDRHGSYAQVRTQLDWLSLVAPQRFHLVRVVLVEHQPREIDSTMHREMCFGVVMIARRIPNPRVPPWLIERTAAEEKRDSIAALAADGFTAGQIAKRIGLPKEAVRRKLKGIALASASRRNPPPGDARRMGALQPA